MFGKRFLTCILVNVCIAGLAVGASATIQIPKTMNYQGYLTDSSGTPINGTRNLRFRLYDAGGTVLNWNETHNNVPITNGIFNVVLGASAGPSANHIDETFRKPYYLEISVYHPPSGPWEAMSPRHLLTNAAYAMAARKIVNQQVLVVAHDGGDTCTVSGAIDMLMGQGAFPNPLAPAPSISTQWVIEVKAGRYNELGTVGGMGAIVMPDWVTVRGQGWDATELQVSQINMAGNGRALESLMVSNNDGNPVINMSTASYGYIRECRIEANMPQTVIDMTSASNCDVVDTTLVMYMGFNCTGIGIMGTTDCRVENCVIDMRNCDTGGCAGITDNAGGVNPTHGVCLLENTIVYMTNGTPTGTYGIGLMGGEGPAAGRVSYNVFNLGAPTHDITILPAIGTGLPIGGPNGICNQDSLGAQIAAF